MRVYLWELRKLAAQRRTFVGLVAAALIPAGFATGLAVSPAKPASAGGQIDPDVVLALAYNSSGLVLPFIAIFFSSLVLLPLLAGLLVAGAAAAAGRSGRGRHRGGGGRHPHAQNRPHQVDVAATAARRQGRRHRDVRGDDPHRLRSQRHPHRRTCRRRTSGHPRRFTGYRPSFCTPSIGVASILGRLILVLAIYAAPLLAVSAWGFMLSTITRNSAASIVGMLVFSFANQIIGFLPNISTSITRWLLTDQFTAWQAALSTSIDVAPLRHALGVSALYAIPPLLLSAWWFNRRDITV